MLDKRKEEKPDHINKYIGSLHTTNVLNTNGYNQEAKPQLCLSKEMI